MPTGTVVPFAGSSAPTNWLLCNGTNVSRSTYASLFTLIGTTYGAGDGSTTFALPDLRGRVVAGLDNMGGSAASRLTSTTITGGADDLGEVGGSQTHTLTTSEMPSHTHTQNSHNHTQNSHNHGIPLYVESNFTGFIGSNGHGGVFRETVGTDTVTPTNIATTATNQNTGGGGAHNNVQPTMVLNYIIRT
jgi:microcystin-dependent protein